jgi:hypothetical protein
MRRFSMIRKHAVSLILAAALALAMLVGLPSAGGVAFVQVSTPNAGLASGVSGGGNTGG